MENEIELDIAPFRVGTPVLVSDRLYTIVQMEVKEDCDLRFNLNGDTHIQEIKILIRLCLQYTPNIQPMSPTWSLPNFTCGRYFRLGWQVFCLYVTETTSPATTINVQLVRAPWEDNNSSI